MTETRVLVERIRDAVDRAERAGLVLPNAMTLATVRADGQPSARLVLLKSIDEDGLVFYTNLGSRKATDLAHEPRAALCFWWGALEEQIRVEGSVSPVSDAEADAYFATRLRGSQLGAWASRQSEPLASREALVDAFRRYEFEFEGQSVPRPPFWSGYRLAPARIEFWRGRKDRLHERVEYVRESNGWREQLLQP
ncbi:MAG: pyridoxamine 5'-phosphate oxidase [Candidatus Krumholzibacteria bacterium]|nr:pyridoxamine 5'-phosphate oxidase [Candidatus Krumholzibacteria bacterium]